jgi:hypothetical protein
MEQNMLRDLEHRCIQEEPPYCQTACPLKVDARAFCAAMAQERFDEARKILAKTMSLPDILVRICDHPCQSACIRAETGGAVELGRLERACLERTSPAAPPLRLPAKGKTVTVLGGGLSSLVCACELAKKGYRVLLGFTGTLPGGRLLSLPEETLPQNILAETWAFLQKLGVTRSSEEPLSLPALREGEAAYLGMDDPALAHLSTVGAVDSATYETTIEGLFAGGFLRNGSSFSRLGGCRCESAPRTPWTGFSRGHPSPRAERRKFPTRPDFTHRSAMWRRSLRGTIPRRKPSAVSSASAATA